MPLDKWGIHWVRVEYGTCPSPRDGRVEREGRDGGETDAVGTRRSSRCPCDEKGKNKKENERQHIMKDTMKKKKDRKKDKHRQGYQVNAMNDMVGTEIKGIELR